MGLSLSLRVYLDTNVFIQAFEGANSQALLIQDSIQILETHPDVGVTSELTLAELLVPKDPDLRALILRRLLSDSPITLKAVTRAILIRSAGLRNEAVQRKLPDAIHVATALETGCTCVLSFDRDMERLPAPFICIKPDAAGIASLKEALA